MLCKVLVPAKDKLSNTIVNVVGMAEDLSLAGKTGSETVVVYATAGKAAAIKELSADLADMSEAQLNEMKK
jgi:hypothetical protein